MHHGLRGMDAPGSWVDDCPSPRYLLAQTATPKHPEFSDSYICSPYREVVAFYVQEPCTRTFAARALVQKSCRERKILSTVFV